MAIDYSKLKFEIKDNTEDIAFDLHNVSKWSFSRKQFGVFWSDKASLSIENLNGAIESLELYEAGQPISVKLLHNEEESQAYAVYSIDLKDATKIAQSLDLGAFFYSNGKDDFNINNTNARGYYKKNGKAIIKQTDYWGLNVKVNNKEMLGNDSDKLLELFYDTFDSSLANPEGKHNSRTVNVYIPNPTDYASIEREFREMFESNREDCYRLIDIEYCEELRREFSSEDFAEGFCDCKEPEGRDRRYPKGYQALGLHFGNRRGEECIHINIEAIRSSYATSVNTVFVYVLLHEIAHSIMTDEMLRLFEVKPEYLDMFINPNAKTIYSYFKTIEESLANAYPYFHNWSSEQSVQNAIKAQLEDGKIPYKFAPYWTENFDKLSFGDMVDSWGNIKREKSHLFCWPHGLERLRDFQRSIRPNKKRYTPSNFNHKLWEE